MKQKTRSFLKKYQFGTPMGSSFGGFESPTLETWSPSPSSPTYEPTDPSVYLNSSVVPENSVLLGQNSSQNSSNGSSYSGQGIAGGLNAIAGGLSSAAAGMRANTRSEIDPKSIYAYDPSKSGFQGHKEAARTTAAVLGMAGGVASSIPNPVAQIIGAGLNVGAAGTEMGLADLEKRLIRAHDAMYKQRMNVGGKDGNFTTQGQFTTREAQEDPGIPMAKKGRYLKQYMGGGMMGMEYGGNMPLGEPIPVRKGKSPYVATYYYQNGGRIKKYQDGEKVSDYMDALSGMDRDSIINPRYPSDTDVAMSKLEEVFPFLQYGNKDYSIDQYQAAMQASRLYLNAPMTDQRRIEREENTVAGKPLSLEEQSERDNTGYYRRDERDETGLKPKTPNRYTAKQIQLDEDTRNSGMMIYANGGRFRKTQMGGEMVVSEGVPERYANAELEGREIVEKAKGPDIYVKGPSHEKGGVPMKLQEGGPAQGGDYVWSDHLTYKGKTMAELYAMAVQNGASEQEIDQLRMLQEQLAGRAGDPQDAKELQEMPMAKNGGMLKKYQNGTEDGIPYNTSGPLAEEMEEEESYVVPRPPMSTDYSVRNTTTYKKPQYSIAPKDPIGDYVLDTEEKDRQEDSENKALKVYGKRSVGDKAMELLPYGTAGAGMIAQLAATLGAKNPYKGIKTPSAALVSTPEKQFFERINSRAEEAQNARGASLSKQLLQQAGFGPGETAAVQKVELDRQAADAQATQRAREFNVSQDRAEKQLNTEMKLRSEMANQAALNERSMQEYQRMLSERGFEVERGMNAADIGAGSLLDIGKIASDRTFAKAIEGDSGVGQRAWNYDPVQARAEIMSENPQKAGESGSEYQSRINRLERENSKRYEEEYMRKVAERRRRYTQMRGTDGEQG